MTQDCSSSELRPLGLVILLLGLFLPLTDFFIVNVALPTIDHDLHASPGMLQLVVAGYGTAYAVLLVVGARVGDAIGRRRLFVLGMGAFTVTSLVCGLAPNVLVLVLARAAEGAAAAMMLPQVLSTIHTAADGPSRARALGYYGVAGGLATVAGQLLGGLLVSANIAGTGWRPIFLLNVPVGILGVLLSRNIPATRSNAPTPVDGAGTSVLGATLLAFLIPLTEGRSLGWPLWTIFLLCLSPILAVLFILVERRVEAGGGVPVVPLSVISVRSFWRGTVTGTLFFISFGGFMFVYALCLQDGAGWSALRTGLTMVPLACGYLAASLAMPRLLARIGTWMLTIGAMFLVFGFALLAVVLTAGWPHPAVVPLCAASLAIGIGQGMILTPLFRIMLSEVPLHLAGVGSGVLNTMQQTSLVVGVATVGSLYLSDSNAKVLGVLHATVLVLVALALVEILVGWSTRGLPDAARERAQRS
ncbi:MFS transporter [Ferrimicrobium sp.]|uniref:MFS transporter n=1 Tax=Ferrimicrobium sp. TaxID=2926050 RepID=UPI0026271009|nr:MFS transporter [Ferrimicrobium sp.]